MPVDRGMGKENVDIHAVEYYSAIKKNEMMPFAATLLGLQSVIPRGVSQRNSSSPTPEK